MSRITVEQLEEYLRDLEISDEDLSQYFTYDETASNPLSPALKIDETKVDVPHGDPRTEGGVAFGFVNSAARYRRKLRYQARRRKDPNAKVVISEGDSWFQFPFFLRDVGDQLHDAGFPVLCSAAAGDTVQNMVWRDREYMDAIAEAGDAAGVFLFSGGGNDVIGKVDDENVLASIVRPYTPGATAESLINRERLDTKIGEVEAGYEKLVADIQWEFEGLPIIFHGYAYVIPGNFNAADKRNPPYAENDQWVGAPLNSMQIVDTTVQQAIIKIVLDALHDMQARVQQRHSDVVHQLNLRDMLPLVTSWKDEIHPTNDGFKAVAQPFIERINHLTRDS